MQKKSRIILIIICSFICIGFLYFLNASLETEKSNKQLIDKSTHALFFRDTLTEDKWITLYDVLLEKGYGSNDIEYLFTNLYYQEITPLTVFETVDYMLYADRIIETRGLESRFDIDEDYLQTYTQVQTLSPTKDYLTLVNKSHQLPSDYVVHPLADVNILYATKPTKLHELASMAYEKMAKAMEEEGYYITLVSGYRDNSTQDILYNSYIQYYGEEMGEKLAAKQGYSEHETGFALDLASKYNPISFDLTLEFEWLQKNAHNYGFILRYPKDCEKITGYVYEPWHYRYVGKEVATHIFELQLTFDEYYFLYLQD